MVIDEDKYFQPDPLIAFLILEAFARYDKGESIQGITDWLNEKGMRTRNNRPLNSDNTTRMLKNRKYIGEYKFRDIVTPGGIPAIVPMDLYERVQERFQKNKKAPARYKAEEIYLLTTKLHCGKCGAYMVGESGISKTGRMYRYYKCVNNKNKKGCKKKAVQKDWIQNTVMDAIREMLLDDNFLEYVTDLVMELQTQENTSLPLLKKQLADTEKGIEHMLNAIQQGIITASTKQRLEELEQTKANLEVSILQEEIEHPLLSRDEVRCYVDKYRSMDLTKPAQRQRLVDGFVNPIYVYDDRIVLTFNYKEGTKEISLAEIESSDFGAAPAPHTYNPNFFR